MIHPNRSEYKYIWDWTDACVRAEVARGDFLRQLAASEKAFTQEECDKFNICLSYCEQEVFKAITPTVSLLKRVKLPSSKCPGIFTRSDECDYCMNQRESHGVFVMVFDTETTGLSAHDEVIQLGYVLYDKSGNIKNTYQKIFKTDRKINKFAGKVHNISEEMVRQSKYSSETELMKFKKLVYAIHKNAGIVVAHNASFDKRLINQTTSRHGGFSFEPDFLFCTMLALRKVSPTDRGTTTKNTDVYLFLGGRPLEKMHCAMSDCVATGYIFFTGRRNRWW